MKQMPSHPSRMKFLKATNDDEELLTDSFIIYQANTRFFNNAIENNPYKRNYNPLKCEKTHKNEASQVCLDLFAKSSRNFGMEVFYTAYGGSDYLG
jgi:hypothetical protein